MIAKIGIWELNDFGLTGKIGVSYDYNIGKDTLWDTRNFRGQLVWDWLIHLTEKSWITPENINEFNIAFLFAQDYFKEFNKVKLEDKKITAQTLYIQKQIMDIQKIMGEPNIDDSGIIEFSSERMIKYRDLHNKIKVLEIQ